jgi:hypothetical protein
VNRWGLSWMDEAIRLDAENKQLRELVMQLLLWIGANEGLALFAVAQIEQRFPEARDRERAA